MEVGYLPAAIVPMDVKAPVVALIVYIATLNGTPITAPIAIRHISELAGWIHDHRRGNGTIPDNFRLSFLWRLRPRSWRRWCTSRRCH